MNEILNRRFKRIKTAVENGTIAQKEGDKKEYIPDLIIIDGGKGQLSSAYKAMQDCGLKIDMVSLAKREEEVFKPGVSKPVIFPLNSGALHFFQRIRDEAHRFAITYHRELRGKDALK